MSTKTPLSVYLDPELMRALAAYADRRDKSRSLIAEAAIASFLSPDADEQREAAIAKRLDKLDRRSVLRIHDRAHQGRIALGVADIHVRASAQD